MVSYLNENGFKLKLEIIDFIKLSLVFEKQRIVINLWRKKFLVVFKIFEEFELYFSVIG